MVATVVMMAALMLEPANAQQLIQPRYICDQGMAVACFAGLDAALGNSACARPRAPRPRS
jgi:hypothetical protein